MAIERSASPAREAPPAAASASAPGEAPTRVLTLEHGEHNDSTLYRFKKGYCLQFSPGASLLGRKVFLYTNYVVSDDGEEGEECAGEFVRSQYYGLEWRREGAEGGGAGAGALLTDTDVHCALRLARAGVYHYYFVYDSAESPVGPQGSGWFHVAPTLRVGAGGRTELPLDALMCQTVLAKCLGPLPRWEGALRVSREAGYNVVHFTPVQALGASGSSYSIADQLRLNPAFGACPGREATFADVENLVTKMRTEWKMLSICDVVLNHTANETPWLSAHPDATYNCSNCPHLRPAALLDALLARLTADVARGAHEARGVPRAPSAPDHLEALRHLLGTQLLPEARLHELYTCDAPELVRHFYRLARNKVPAPAPKSTEERELKLSPDPQYRRLRATVDMDLALHIYNVYRADCYDEEARLKKCCEEFKRKLDELNEAAADELRDHLRAALDNVIAGVRYHRLQADGPKLQEVSAKHPLVPRYFTWACDVENSSLAEVEAALYSDAGQLCMAHNGWVMDADPLQDFAARAAGARVYLRRELIAWGDSVKLRYGDKPEDSPFLWAHMREYVELTAEVFDGVRLDNCHSTPLHVAEYMLDCARNVKPDLYVVAELFTNSDLVDNIFVNRLGITSLIREAQSAWDAHEQGRLVHRFGGRAVGSFSRATRREARPRVAHAMLLDLTHDNPSPLARRCVFDVLPCAALVAAACCATGSTRGLDELVPHHVHVVDEARLYPAWGDPPSATTDTSEPRVCADSGIMAAKRALNELHAELATGGYNEVYVDQIDADVVAVTRHAPRERQSVIVVAFTAFSAPPLAPATAAARRLPPLRFEGRLVEIVLEAELKHRDHRSGGSAWRGAGPHTQHPTHITGLDQYECVVRHRVPLGESRALAGAQSQAGGTTELQWGEFAPGGVLVVRVAPTAPQSAALAELAREVDAAALDAALADLDLADFTALLYRCDAEEREAGGGGVYDVPGHGPLVYAGLQGVVSLLDEVTPRDELGHPLCDNLRAGDWLAEYVWRRVEREPRLAPVAACFRSALRPLGALPRCLVPAQFASRVRALHAAVQRAALARLGPAGEGDSLRRALALTSVQLLSAVPSASLPPPSPALPPPRPARALTLSAGLPHFAVGYMRAWGRDTFISLRGLMILTGRYQEARLHILGFGACLRHGLIPNLLDGGRNARYNCRDAVWWWLQSIKQYCSEASQGPALLTEPVARLFPTDDAEPAPPGVADQPLHDVIQEALDVHFQGLVFRERNAGRAIDAHMSDKGFNMQIGIDPETGFPFGGNDSNCGTWMDKMGSSEAAGTRGKPATPRDGSAVELVGLAYSVASWLASQHRAGRYPYPGVVRRHRDGSLTSWTFAQWAERIRNNFERCFWVPPAPSATDLRPDLVHRRAIYKDSHGASQPWADYQLRCNFPVAMVVAPELFDPRHAWLALDNVERLLRGPLGLKTLDPADWAYRPDYDNANNSDDPSVAHGFNYHQGPEWLWPLGFYLRARLAFAHQSGQHARTVASVYAALGPLLAELRASPWRGLPELSNAGGAPCAHSCRTQAWSSAVVLELLQDLEAARRARPLPPD